MKRRPVFVCVCALLALVAVAAACKSGGGGTSTAGSTALGTAGPPLTLQEYFQHVQALDSRASQRLAVIGQALTPASSDEQKLSVVRDLATGLAAIDKDLRDGLQRITPPPEAKAAHQAAIEALTQHINLAETASDPSTNDPLAILTSPEAGVADASLSKACQDLRHLAAARGIAVTLSCGQ